MTHIRWPRFELCVADSNGGHEKGLTPTDSFSVLLFQKCDWYVVVGLHKLKRKGHLFAVQLFK